MKVAVLAPPWLPIPPSGYGGTENVLAVLVPALQALGVQVELFTIGETLVKSSKNHSLYRSDQYEHVHEPWYNSLPIIAAQTLFAFNKIQAAGDFDIISSHNAYVDPLAAAYADDLPPVIHTIHGPPFTTPSDSPASAPDNRPLWRELGKSQRLSRSNNLYVIPISRSLSRNAPRELRHIVLKPVHNGLDPAQFPLVTNKSDYFVTLGRSHPDKGWGIAVKTCLELGYPLKLAGIVGTLSRARDVMLELANPLSKYRSTAEFKYFSDEIFPYLEEHSIEYVGSLSGQNKLDFLSHARGFLFPIQWEEPFGMVVIEALACGTPVVAMARGALPEIIQHGVNGFLANDEKEFASFTKRVGEIDPAACRKSVEDNFSAACMARNYLDRFESVLSRRQPAANRRGRRSQPR